MNKSKISKTILMSAIAVSSGLLPAVLNSARASDSAQDYSQNDGFVDFDQFREAVSRLREQVAQDPGFRESYLANPRKVLSEAGLPVNLQLEMMRDDGLAYGPAFKAMDCICTQTCLKTN